MYEFPIIDRLLLGGTGIKHNLLFNFAIRRFAFSEVSQF